MCGITGFVDLRGRQPMSDMVAIARDMADSLRHRGPDDAGTWADEEVGIVFGHRRLAIIDLSREGRQPMISADVGDHTEAVIDGKTGYVVPARDPKALAEAILRLAADGGARASMGGKGEARVKDYFSVARCVSDYVQLYEGLAGPDHRLPRALRMIEKEPLCVDS